MRWRVYENFWLQQRRNQNFHQPNCESENSANRGTMNILRKPFNQNLTEVADALTDIPYVTYGAGHAFGINLDKCFEEVQNSNMSKLDENGKPIYTRVVKL